MKARPLRPKFASALAATGLLFAILSCSSHDAPANGDGAASAIDPDLAQAIDAIQAIDNHAHPVLAPPLDATEKEFDALPVSNMEPQSDPPALRPDFPLLAAAWKALYGFDSPPPLDSAALQRLNDARGRVKAQHGEQYPTWVLDQAKIGTQLANRVAMGSGVEPPRFLWVPYVDALLFPLDNSGMAAASPDRRQFFALEELVRRRYLYAAKLQRRRPRWTRTSPRSSHPRSSVRKPVERSPRNLKSRICARSISAIRRARKSRTFTRAGFAAARPMRTTTSSCRIFSSATSLPNAAASAWRFICTRWLEPAAISPSPA